MFVKHSEYFLPGLRIKINGMKSCKIHKDNGNEYGGIMVSTNCMLIICV